jgi:hypothetical protein
MSAATELVGPRVTGEVRSSRTDLWRPAAVLVSAAGALAIVATVDPNVPGHYPTCPFLAVTGHWCPGCGSLRALHALTGGDLLGAASRNVLLVASIPLLTWWWVRWVWRTWTGAARRVPAPGSYIWTGAALVVVFWIVRNLSFGAALAP